MTIEHPVAENANHLAAVPATVRTKGGKKGWHRHVWSSKPVKALRYGVKMVAFSALTGGAFVAAGFVADFTVKHPHLFS